jgi:hypothetical protein
MKKMILLVLTICLICVCFTGCENKNDIVDIHNKSSYIFDNIHIETKDGYFYKSHEKFTVDEDTIGVTIYFSIDENDDSWDTVKETD